MLGCRNSCLVCPALQYISPPVQHCCNPDSLAHYYKSILHLRIKTKLVPAREADAMVL